MTEKIFSQPASQAPTGWPPGMLQDDSKPLSKWLSSQPDAKATVPTTAAIGAAL